MNDNLLALQRAYADLIIRIPASTCSLASASTCGPSWATATSCVSWPPQPTTPAPNMWRCCGWTRWSTRFASSTCSRSFWASCRSSRWRAPTSFSTTAGRASRLIGDEYPDALEEVEPAVLRTYQRSVYQKLGFFSQRTMNNEVSWCVAGVPVAPWAQKIYPDLDAATALERLWEMVLRVCRADQPDPNAAWQEHDANLKKVVGLHGAPSAVRAVRFLDRQRWSRRPARHRSHGRLDRSAQLERRRVAQRGRPLFLRQHSHRGDLLDAAPRR
jgi:hypothetical protein